MFLLLLNLQVSFNIVIIISCILEIQVYIIFETFYMFLHILCISVTSTFIWMHKTPQCSCNTVHVDKVWKYV